MLKKQTKPKTQKQPKPPKKAKARSRPAAVFADQCRRIGLKDLRAHELSWVCGRVYIGDGTFGLLDQIYFLTGDLKIVDNAQAGQVPILGSDEGIGVNYVRDIEKYFSRKVIKSLKVRFVSTTPSTANSMMVTVGPVRGCSSQGDTIVISAPATPSPVSLMGVMSMQGAKSFASYESCELDLTKFVAGGSGPYQNEFSINADGESASQWGTGSMDLVGISPAGFVVAGTNGTTGLRGGTTHYVVVEMVVDLLDFLGGVPNSNPTALIVKSKEDALFLLKLIMMSGQKDAASLPITKSLVKFVGKGLTQ